MELLATCISKSNSCFFFRNLAGNQLWSEVVLETAKPPESVCDWGEELEWVGGVCLFLPSGPATHSQAPSITFFFFLQQGKNEGIPCEVGSHTKCDVI